MSILSAAGVRPTWGRAFLIIHQQPSKETLQDLQGAQAQTNAYRFPTRILPHEPPPPHLEMGGR